LVHRLLLATLNNESTIADFPLNGHQLQSICEHSNDKRMASKHAQERCDRIFLSVYVLNHPMRSELAVVVGVKENVLDMFLPSIGISRFLFLEEHKDWIRYEPNEMEDGSRSMILIKYANGPDSSTSAETWSRIEIKVFVKLAVTIYCRDKPPIDVKVRLERPWAP
jgi:exoribonuclease R